MDNKLQEALQKASAELARKEALRIKKESLVEYARASEDDPEVVEMVKPVLVEDRIAELEQAILDDQEEIDRRTAHKAIAEAELAKYK